MSRKEGNEKILEILKDFLEANPDTRFIQALWTLGIIDRQVIDATGFEVGFVVDRFHEEPHKTLERILNRTRG